MFVRNNEHDHALVIPGDQAAVYSSRGKSRESSVLNVNPGYTLHTKNQYNNDDTKSSPFVLSS